jgi:hypothetical protein
MTETKEKLGNTKNSLILGPKFAEFLGLETLGP